MDDNDNDICHVKSEEPNIIDIQFLTMIQQMGKFNPHSSSYSYDYEFPDHSPSTFPASCMENPAPAPPPFSSSMNNVATSSFHHPFYYYLPNSAGAGRWKTHELEESAQQNSMVAMREMIYQVAAMQPIHIDPESVKPRKRRNVKISKDPQSVAARQRRERISERIRILQRIVPGGTKMDTASMLDEAVHYVKFLKNQVQSLETASAAFRQNGLGFPVAMSGGTGSNFQNRSDQQDEEA